MAIFATQSYKLITVEYRQCTQYHIVGTTSLYCSHKISLRWSSSSDNGTDIHPATLKYTSKTVVPGDIEFVQVCI